MENMFYDVTEPSYGKLRETN